MRGALRVNKPMSQVHLSPFSTNATYTWIDVVTFARNYGCREEGSLALPHLRDLQGEFTLHTLTDLHSVQLQGGQGRA